MAVALKDFRYWDFERKESVQVQAGDTLDAERLARHNVDLAKLGRTKYADLTVGEGAERAPEPVKRGRKRGG